MAQFIQNLIEAARTANDRDEFNMYDFIGASLVGIFLVLVFILGAALETLGY